MSLLTSTVYRELEGVLAPREATSSYTLTHTEAGWALLVRFGTAATAAWSTPLAPHGAGTDAPARVAQAVGVRVLQELGVEVSGWVLASDGDTDHFVAETTSRTRRILDGLHGH